MKKIIQKLKRAFRNAALFGGLLAASLPAAAQFRSESISTTNSIAATTTNSAPYAGVMDATRVSDFALQITHALTGSGSSAVAWAVSSSVDGVNYASSFTISSTANGTNTVSITPTNVNCRAIPYWKITSIGNPNASAVTNITVTFGAKRNRD